MSQDLILDAYSKWEESSEWKSVLIKYNHKTRPNQFKCFTFNFDKPEDANEIPKNLFENFTKIIDKNNYIVKDYTASNEKTVIEKITTNNRLLSEAWGNLINSVNVCDDSIQLNKIKPDAYAFIGSYFEDGFSKNLYLISKKNPIITATKAKPTTIFRQPIITIFDMAIDRSYYSKNWNNPDAIPVFPHMLRRHK